MDLRSKTKQRKQDIHDIPPKHSPCPNHGQPSNGRSSSRLILCFDGTGNEFQGTPGDTNIVKLYNMFGRTNNSQLHYYQPGIGTYPPEGPVNVNWFRTMLRKFEAVKDAAVATSFDSHVIAGYKFVMRYYRPGDRIYIFGFSRGAYTARFLSRMISHVGLLSKGNEELIPFTYQVYEKYEQNRLGTDEAQKKHIEYMNTFKRYFCRTELEDAEVFDEEDLTQKIPSKVEDQDSSNAKPILSPNESGIKVHFLGLFDCVSSVGNLDVPFFQKAPPLPAAARTACHVRHAVAIDERRVKFKAALFSQEQQSDQDDIKEVWFPGNHGDIGGGWDVDTNDADGPRMDKSNDHFQLSDIALKWMIDEINHVESTRDPADRLAWDQKETGDFLHRFESHKHEMVGARMHDTMTFGGGTIDKSKSAVGSFFATGPKIWLWNFMEWLPFIIKRWEYVDKPKEPTSWSLSGNKGKTEHRYVWDYIGWPPNRGGRRDIPSNALFHRSVKTRMKLDPADNRNALKERYAPSNPLWAQFGKPKGDCETNGVNGTNGINGTTGTHNANPSAEPTERNLRDLADLYKPKDSNSDSERQPLRGPKLHFTSAWDVTTGPLDAEGKRIITDSVEINGKKVYYDSKWDKIYRVYQDKE